VSPESDAGWFAVAEPVVRSIVRDELQVGLRSDDDRRENQDALELVQDVYSDLTEAVAANSDGIHDVKSYAAKVTYNACAEYLRHLYPARTRLRNKIHYFLTHQTGFAVWETQQMEICCGYAGWRNALPANAGDVQALIAEPARIWASSSRPDRPKASKGSGPIRGEVKALDVMKAADWSALVEEILDALARPLKLSHLVAIASTLFRVKDEPPDTPMEPSINPRFDDVVYRKEQMQRLWQVLQNFEHRWLMAFLLNLPGLTKEARGEIEAFESSEVATRDQIGRLLGMIGQEYEDLGYETPQWPPDPGSPEARLGSAWPFLPREDTLIARALRCEKQQVINLRQVAIQKIACRMKEMLAAKNN
jgi:hypothetical protein